jgi:hypothetical protein
VRGYERVCRSVREYNCKIGSKCGRDEFKRVWATSEGEGGDVWQLTPSACLSQLRPTIILLNLLVLCCFPAVLSTTFVFPQRPP